MAIAPFQACRRSLTREQMREAAQATVTSTPAANLHRFSSIETTAKSDSTPAVYWYGHRQGDSRLCGWVALVELPSLPRLRCPMPADAASARFARECLDSTHQQLAPVLALYDADPVAVPRTQLTKTSAGAESLEIEPISDPQVIGALDGVLSESPITVIAGQEWLQAAEGHPVMALLVNQRTCPPEVGPVHRTVRWNPGWHAGDMVRLGREHFFFHDITRLMPQVGKTGDFLALAEEHLRPNQEGENVYVAVTKSHTFRIHSLPSWADSTLADRSPEERAISAVQLHEILIPDALGFPRENTNDPRVNYTGNMDEAVARVNRGDADVAFLMNAPNLEQIVAVARTGGSIPPHSFRAQLPPIPGAITYAF